MKNYRVKLREILLFMFDYDVSAAHVNMIKDIENMSFNKDLAIKAMEYVVSFSPDWVYCERGVLRILCVFFLEYSLLDIYDKKNSYSHKPATITINKVEYIIP